LCTLRLVHGMLSTLCGFVTSSVVAPPSLFESLCHLCVCAPPCVTPAHPVIPCVCCIPATRMALDSAVDALSELLGSLTPSITVSPGGTTVSATSELHVASVYRCLVLITDHVVCCSVCVCDGWE
jgi:hypothetical protein